MFKQLALLATVMTAFAVVMYASAERAPEQPAKPPLPDMKFDDVKEIAPGVFFRYSSISATDPKSTVRRQQQHLGGLQGLRVRRRCQLPQGSRRRHCRHQEDDQEADQVRPRHAPPRRPRLRQLRLGQGRRQIIASKPTARLLKTNGPKQWEDASKGPMGRQDLKRQRTEAGRHHLRRQVRARRPARNASRSTPSATATPAGTRWPIFPSSRSCARAMRA